MPRRTRYLSAGGEPSTVPGLLARNKPTSRYQKTVVGDVEHAATLTGEVRRRGVRCVGIEEHDVAGLGRHRTGIHAAHVVGGEGRPLIADESPRVVSRGQLQAPVPRGGGIDADHRGDEQVGVGAPARLLVLMGLEAVAPGQLEVDLVLEEHGRLAEEPGREAAQLVAVAQGREAGMERAEVLDPLEHPLSRTEQARLEVHHAPARRLGLTL